MIGPSSPSLRPQQHRSKGHTPSAAASPTPLADSELKSGSGIIWPSGFRERYVFGEELGKGSFGTVSVVFDRQTGRERAVKVVPKQRKNTCVTKLAEKMRLEVDILRELQHRPEAVQLHGVYQDENSVFIVTELCRGGSLEDFLLSQGALTEPETAKVMRDILAVIRGCHTNSICYADVKPANFLLKNVYPDARCLIESKSQTDRTLEVRVVDFGCSQRIKKGERLEKRVGTPLYMAPETFMGYFGQECDMWSLGMLLHQMLVGALPFWGGKVGQQMRLSPVDVMQGILAGDLDFQAPGWQQVSDEAKDLVARLLDRDHNTRITAEQAWEHPWLQENCHEEEGCDLATELYEMSSLHPSSEPQAWHDTPAGSHVVRSAWAHHL
ncbi:hypothetical protein WJX84_009379 [Apatococcus fuscideae]|uniref:Protein kinase domain-containing protein n=1 Tax=Apatococcus fuscideae TaxID=2026836 RepID=A0AAW1SSB7_9CHLO